MNLTPPRHRTWYHRGETAGLLARADNLAGEIVEAYRAMFPLIQWLREALIGNSELGYLSPQEVDHLLGAAA